jgi:restriction system protein
MTGREFERFLAEVFREHGYEVKTTGGVRDQGVDLIVARGGARIAIQAKGYVGYSVGNDAVQQAHAGCSYHHCHRSAVVTNARFTTAARMLAERVGCRLIDRDSIPELIEGRIVL